MARPRWRTSRTFPTGCRSPTNWRCARRVCATSPRARATIEARAKERHARELAEHEAKMATRVAKIAANGKSLAAARRSCRPKDLCRAIQVNLTDEESRIMPVAGGGFEQCYNAQAAVAAGSLLVVAIDVVQAPNDKQQVEPMLGKIAALPEELGMAENLAGGRWLFQRGQCRGL